jgi:hypothetical protein
MSRASDRRQFANDMYESFEVFDGMDDEEAEYGGRQPGDPRCKFCGSTDVRWRQQGGQWVMFELQPGVVHDCRGRLGRMQASEFTPTGD